MDKLIISDTSCLIVLTNSNQLEILPALFGAITVTPLVASEYGLPLPEWIRIESPKDILQQEVLEIQLDAGEASAISLALENKDSLLLIDEKKGRRVAHDLGIHIMGTVRLLILARQKGLSPSLRESLNAILNAGFRLAPSLVQEILEQYGD